MRCRDLKRDLARSCGVALLCLAVPVEVSATGPVYRVELADDLSHVWVEARLPGDVGPLRSARGDLAEMEALSGCNAEAIETARGRILADAPACLRYRYPLNPQAGRRSPAAAPGVVVSTPGEWLWTPDLTLGSPIRIELSLPTAMAVSVPWRPLAPGIFELAASPGSAVGTAVFGDFENRVLEVGGARLRVAAVNGPDRQLDPSKILDWLAVAAADVAGVAGRFPNPDLQIIVQPVASRGRSPVPFGYVARNGGEAVRFYVDGSRALEDFHRDWTATHEFSHLLLPYVRSSEKWVSEGFASYYQNVLLARRGAYSPEEAWSRLHRAFVRASRVPDPPPLDRLSERPFREMRMLVYWSGAAMALEADVRLRRLTGESLDQVLGRLAACCLPSERTWRARELFEKLDALSPDPVFLPLYEAYLSRRGMPDLDGLYAALGLAPASERRMTLLDEGRLMSVRDAIMAGSD